MKNLSIIMLFTLLVVNVKAQEANPRIVETAEGGIFLEWDSLSDCTYEIDYTADLTAGFTQSAASRIGTGSTMRVSIAEVSGFPLPQKAFVRLNVTEGLDGAFLLNVDSDGDGLPNSYELVNGLDFNDPNDATLDLDGDGLNALEEFELGTSPYINNNDQTVVMGSEQLVPGDGGGDPFSGVLQLPTNQEVITVVGDGDEDVAVDETGTFSFAVNSSAFFVVVAVYTDEYPTYTGDDSEFNDTVEYTVTPSVGTAVNGSLNVNSIHDALSTAGKDFDLGDGERFYSFEEEVVFQNTPREAFTIDYDLSATNIGDSSLPSGVTVAAFPVQIQPIASDAGRLGDLILSQDGLSGEKHFVSTKRNSSLNDEFIEFEITGIPQAVFDEFLEWEGGVAGDTSLRRKVSREQAAQTQLKVKVSSSSTVVDILNVWTVWVNISGSVGSVAPKNVSTPLPGGAGIGQIGEQVKAVYTSVNAIQPASIITGSDIPNLSGENAIVPPGGQSIDGEPLSGGASTKWDMSRRLQRTITLGGDIAAGAMPGGSLDQNTSFPDNPIVGNDDAYGSPKPATDPYSNGGNLQSLDTPTRTLTFVGGNAGATYLNVSSFQEFARLEINGKWYLISDVDPWTVNFRFSKIEVNEAFWNFDANQDGDTADAISEQQVNQDLNRNGSSSDNLSIWINNNSDTQN